VRYIVGIDVGGTNVVVGTVAEDGSELLGLVAEPTFAEQGPDAVVERIVKLAKASLAAAKGKTIAGVGIGSPGPLDTKRGVVLLTPNLGWTDMPLRERIASGLHLPAALGGAAPPAARTTWWASPSGPASAAASCCTVRSTTAHPTSPARSAT
jgi:glucokinase